MAEPTHCSFAGGKCEFNNTKDCPSKSVLRHCQVLRDQYQEQGKEEPADDKS